MRLNKPSQNLGMRPASPWNNNTNKDSQSCRNTSRLLLQDENRGTSNMNILLTFYFFLLCFDSFPIFCHLHTVIQQSFITLSWLSSYLTLQCNKQTFNKTLFHMKRVLYANQLPKSPSVWHTNTFATRRRTAQRKHPTQLNIDRQQQKHGKYQLIPQFSRYIGVILLKKIHDDGGLILWSLVKRNVAALNRQTVIKSSGNIIYFWS